MQVSKFSIFWQWLSNSVLNALVEVCTPLALRFWLTICSLCYYVISLTLSYIHLLYFERPESCGWICCGLTLVKQKMCSYLELLVDFSKKKKKTGVVFLLCMKDFYKHMDSPPKVFGWGRGTIFNFKPLSYMRGENSARGAYIFSLYFKTCLTSVWPLVWHFQSSPLSPETSEKSVSLIW